ncbi:TPA: hypothetical protein QHR60_004015 [Escherichia coli]|jgi:hypothetical protein|uniref:hypothetical protein n=1 Tax=Pantoea sp. CCBC3-3-1 TaxID=2490851 RepID=UPI0011BE04B6|nr:hypothetical protein [Pantoea sp. CCBC3-3-1]HDT5032184.1 hypothetical protein [Escherichia coli]
MAKIYSFPQGAERRRLQRKIQWDRAVSLSKNGWSKATKQKSALSYLSAGWYYFRLSLAAIFHIVTVCGLAVISAFSGAIFWIGGLICVVTWFTNNHQIWSANNFTIPVVVGFWVLSLVAAPLIEYLNAKLPFYRFLVPDTRQEQSSETNT